MKCKKVPDLKRVFVRGGAIAMSNIRQQRQPSGPLFIDPLSAGTTRACERRVPATTRACERGVLSRPPQVKKGESAHQNGSTEHNGYGQRPVGKDLRETS